MKDSRPFGVEVVVENIAVLGHELDPVKRVNERKFGWLTVGDAGIDNVDSAVGLVGDKDVLTTFYERSILVSGLANGDRGIARRGAFASADQSP